MVDSSPEMISIDELRGFGDHSVECANDSETTRPSTMRLHPAIRAYILTKSARGVSNMRMNREAMAMAPSLDDAQADGRRVRIMPNSRDFRSAREAFHKSTLGIDLR